MSDSGPLDEMMADTESGLDALRSLEMERHRARLAEIEKLGATARMQNRQRVLHEAREHFASLSQERQRALKRGFDEAEREARSIHERCEQPRQ